ncbi:MAG: hypothetical protein O3B24_06195 [Verrucomicrobia bacterium]|nr:hypothetical protein [Verrucomicrobiota bacterium]
MTISRSAQIQIGCGVIAVALVATLFHVWGVAAVEPGVSHSLFRWIAGQWNEAGGNYSHA